MSGYGYSGYGYGYDGDGGASYGGYASYGGLPNAAPRLTGPGSSAYVGGPYGGSYAYETQAGGIYVHTFVHTSLGYMNDTSYRYSGDTYKLTQSTSYTDYADKSGPSYGQYAATGYYTSYGPAIVYSRDSFSLIQHDVGDVSYFDNTNFRTTESTAGYVYSDYTHQTSMAVDGQPVAGAGYAYFESATTDPYGSTTYSSHTATF